MATLRDIKNRITSVQSTRKITRTMEMVATARIRRAQERIESARPYALAMVEVLGNVVRYVTDVQHPLLEVHAERNNVLIIAVSSDRGLAGAFNSNIMKMAEGIIAEESAAGARAQLITTGKKALNYFRYRGMDPIASWRDMSDKPTLEHARAIGRVVIDGYSGGDFDAVYVLFNRFKNIADQKPETHQLLPIEHSSLEAAEEDVARRGANPEYLFEPGSEAVLESLLPTYVETLVYRALLESAASEQGARRTAMKSATDNASDMITTLTRSYNRARQAAITTEIAEIVGGAASLEEDK